jgi:uncharacterized lipoprotein YajG
MKKIILLACILLFPGCTVKYPETANLSLQVPVQSSLVYTNSTASVRGHDARENPEIIVFKVKNEPVVKILNLNSPHIVITERLADGLREQGLQFKSNSPVRILLNVNQLLVTVTKSNLLYNSEAVSEVTLDITNSKTSLTKKYTRNHNQGSISRPKIDQIEKMLNDQLSAIVNQVLMDIEFRESIGNM